ncbi:GNAT family N-acetyltransferase [Kitasatospora sp. NPDC006697]|uniref:GNAT family N-acetyltransferase n=1 Tax=Kitasatospora sp. NPDC006697 TaxID=3364020 RepID=UPI0036AE1C60
MLSHPLADGAELRALEPWRAEEFHAFIERARPHLAPWLPWATAMDDPAKVRHWLTRCAEAQARDGKRIFGIWLDGELVGGIEFASFDPALGTCELGAWLAPEAEGRGLITRAARHLIDWALHTRGLTRVQWRATTANTRSLAVAHRLGMRREGVLRSAFTAGGVRQDVEVWALVAERG